MTAAPSRATIGLAGAAALVPLSSTMIAVALTDLEGDLDVGVGPGALWLVSGYLVVAALAQPVGGRVGDRLGHRRAFLGGLIAFAAISVAAAAAPSFAALVGARLAQGVAGALLVPNAVALLRGAIPPERRGRAFGWFGTAMALGAATGPVVGGGLVDAVSWRATFLVNVPLGLAALLLVRSVPAGAAPVAVGGGPSQRALGAVGVLLRRGAFVSASATILLHTLVLYSLLLLVPLLAAEHLGLGPGSAGLLLAALTGPMIVAGPVGGGLSDRLGRRAPALAGGGLVLAATLAMAAALPDPPTAGLVALLLLVGVGLGLASAALQVSAVESAPPGAAALAGGLFTTGRYSGGILAAGLVALTAADGAFVGAAAVLAVCAGAALVASLGLPRRPGLLVASPVP